MLAGTADGFHRLVHGHSPRITDTVMPAPAASMLPLSSIARVRMFAGADRRPASSRIDHDDVPVRLACQVVPPSTDTSTAATAPPPFVRGGAADGGAVAAFDRAAG